MSKVNQLVIPVEKMDILVEIVLANKKPNNLMNKLEQKESVILMEKKDTLKEIILANKKIKITRNGLRCLLYLWRRRII